MSDFDIQFEDLPPGYREVADAIGLDKAISLARVYSGEKIHIPEAETIARAVRDRTIRNNFDGGNYDELARRHGLSVRWVRAIIDRDLKQLPLFPHTK